MSEQTDVLKEVARKLERAGIHYMVSGSIASSYFAQPRMTRDIDIVIEIDSHNTEALVQAFSSGYYIDEIAVKDAVARKSMFNIIQLESMIKIDFIVRKESTYRTTEFQRRAKVEIDDASISFVTPEDLLISKLVWALDSRSETQLNDVKSIMNAVSGLDWGYIDHWAVQLELTELLKEVRS